jgi:Chlorophyll A-B binding protein
MSDPVPSVEPMAGGDATAAPAESSGAGATPAKATSATTDDVPAFGWSGYAERVNGRFAMLGFAAVLLIEALSGDTFLHWAGLVPSGMP